MVDALTVIAGTLVVIAVTLGYFVGHYTIRGGRRG